MMRKRTSVLLLIAIVATMTWLSDMYAQEETSSGRIEGVVTDAETGQPLPNIEVRTEQRWYRGEAKTDAQGRYSLDVDVDNGNGGIVYGINFSDPMRIYVSTWYDHAYTLRDAKAVSVRAGQVRQIDMKLERAGIIRATLKVDEELIQHTNFISIDISDVDDPATGFSNGYDVRSSGEYRFVGVPPGRYIVSILIYDDAADEAYIVGYYDATPRKSQADIVEITSGVTSTADIDLTALSEINGTLRVRSSDQPVQTLSEVVAINEDGEVVAYTYTESNGQYRIQHLMPGMYTVQFTGNVLMPCEKGFNCPRPVYRRQWTEKVEVGPNQVINGLNASIRLIFEPVAYLPLVMR